MTHEDMINFIWGVADLLRGPYRPPQYQRVMLPLTVLRRFDCVLAKTKDKVIKKYKQLKKDKVKEENFDSILNSISGHKFHNHSEFDFEKLKDDPNNIAHNLKEYINGFSNNIRYIFKKFKFEDEIKKLNDSNRLFLLVSRFCDVNLHPEKVSNDAMGLAFENLIRLFNEQANETAGDYFTPREVIEMMVAILFHPDKDALKKNKLIKKLFDPACGTGGMLTEAQNYIYNNKLNVNLYVYGQDYNEWSYPIAASDILIKGHEMNRIEYGDSLVDDKFRDEKFDYFLANPPYGVDWKTQYSEIKKEYVLGSKGRFEAGLPRVNDGSFLFLLHMISKFEEINPKENKNGSRLGIVFNGSPLFSGGAGSGESDIRKWIIEKDWLEAIIALPEQMFYNTSIGTYIWIVTNRKATNRKGKVQLIDGKELWKPMRRSQGNKRRFLGEEDINKIVHEYGNFINTDLSLIFDNKEFGFNRVTVERPLRLKFQITRERRIRFLENNPLLLKGFKKAESKLGEDQHLDWNYAFETVKNAFKEADCSWSEPQKKLFREIFAEIAPEAKPVIKKKTKNSIEYEPDIQLRDYENIPLKENIKKYIEREVLPYAPDAWVDESKTKMGYEINFNKYFYKFVPPRPLEEIDKELKACEQKIMLLLSEVTQ
jgi:type I restriction enzyme M protein